MYDPYISTVKELFTKEKIIINKFHIVSNLKNAINKIRINKMNQFPA